MALSLFLYLPRLEFGLYIEENRGCESSAPLWQSAEMACFPNAETRQRDGYDNGGRVRRGHVPEASLGSLLVSGFRLCLGI